MNRSLHYVLILILLSLMNSAAFARDENGLLALIQLPNNGIPSVIERSGTFNAVLQNEAALSLSKDTESIPLEAVWTRLPGGGYSATCTIDESVPLGVYALEARHGDQVDINKRAVYVIEEVPDNYLAAHVTDVHIGKERSPSKGVDTFTAIVNEINASDAILTLITGDLSESSDPDQFRQFLEIMDLCDTPTFVLPGNHDRGKNYYELFFGPLTYAFTFGKDGYLSFDTKDYLIASEFSGQDNFLYYYRRQIRPTRWSIGISHRYDVSMGLRSQITLFVDDPLDYLLCGHVHREAEEGDGIPWGQTRIIITPAAVDGVFRFLKIDETGLHAQESIHLGMTPLDKN